MTVEITHYLADGATPYTAKDWPNIFGGQTGTAEKFGFRNTDERNWGALAIALAAIPDNDGIDIARIGRDTATLSPPFNIAASLAGSDGVWGATGIVFYVITAFNGTGETIASLEKRVNVTDISKHVALTWDEITGATGYKVFRSTSSGVYGATSRRATVSGGGNNFYDDTGGSLSSGTPPSANTTGGAGPAYGTPPALDTASLAVSAVKIGEMVFYWVNRVTTVGMANAGNPRQWDVVVEEA